MAKRREPWATVYDKIRVTPNRRGVRAPLPTDAELDAVEVQLGSRLPLSYRAFMKRFGSGEIEGWVRIHPISDHKTPAGSPLIERTVLNRKFYADHAESYPNHEWLSNLVYFASSGGGDAYVWDPSSSDPKTAQERSHFYLPRSEETEPVPAGIGLGEFIEWAVRDIDTWQDDAPAEGERTGFEFTPTYLRAKDEPTKKQVKLWLAANNFTVRDLARLVRNDSRLDVLPILADALEEAGCSNADILDSCRHGDPEIDGQWVIDCLLGPSE